MKTAYTFKIGGEAGFGIMSAGLVFSKVAIRSGYHTFDYTEYPSLIRGGHNVMQISVSDRPVYSQFKQTNFLVALNQETIDFHKDELIDGAGILIDPESNINISDVSKNADIFEVPFLQILRENNGALVMRNTVALGAAVGLLGGNLDHLKKLITEEFEGKREDLIKINQLVCIVGYKYVLDNYGKKIKKVLLDKNGQKGLPKAQITVTGNEACALGAIAGGLQFASIYPMTPTSNILHTLAPFQEKYGFIYKQPEDEISAINMAIGAAFAGARSMVATSGGGFCLMTEGYGLAGITETPIVIIEGMRGGPATGLPTWTAQGDLRFVLHAHQGDFPRIVLAAGDVEEAFDLTFKAFNLAEKYQTPVVVLLDKHVCESHMSVSEFDLTKYKIERGKLMLDFDENYKRYALSHDGISPRAVPGLGTHFVANSDEHNEIGYSEESAQNRIDQMRKRMQKLETCMQKDMEAPKLFGPQKADLTIVSWGSNKGAILEAIKNFENVNYLHLTWLNPFPSERVQEILQNATQVLNVECNYESQVKSLIKEKTGFDIQHNLLKFDGRPFYPEEIYAKIKELV